MRATIESVERYVRETLHTRLQLHAWQAKQMLPLLLQHEYDFFQGEILGHELLFLVLDEEQTPASLRKHLEMLAQYWPGSFVVVSPGATPAWRRRMIEKAIPFIVPRNQMYLPMLGVDLRDRFRPHAATRQRRLSPSSQVVLLRALQEPESQSRMPSQVARELHYSAMSVSRALDQLEEFDLIEVSRSGRERRYFLAGDPRSVWETAQPLLSSPVRKQIAIECPPPCELRRALPAGLTALAWLSPLAEPAIPTFAMEPRRFREVVETSQARAVESPDEANRLIQLWTYSPWLLSTSTHVDRLSLYLSLRDDQDERIQSALDEMMAGVRW